MSLRYDVTACAPISEDIWINYSESVIFYTMFVGMPNLRTENDADKFYSRYLMWMRVLGVEPYLNLAIVRKFVGLHTNASAYTDAKFRTIVNKHLDTKIGELVSAEAEKLTKMNPDADTSNHECDYACGSAGYCVVLG